MWASFVRLLNPVTGKKLVEFALPQNEAAFW
jgi:hypothetical protein